MLLKFFILAIFVNYFVQFPPYSYGGGSNTFNPFGNLFNTAFQTVGQGWGFLGDIIDDVPGGNIVTGLGRAATSMAGQVGVPGLSQAANTAVNYYDNTRMAEGKQLIGGRRKGNDFLDATLDALGRY